MPLSRQKDRLVWRPDLYGSTLFLVASAFGILAVGRFLSFQPRSFPWRIAWLNMIGSILFMASALASYVLPSSGEVIGIRIAVAGTLLGALCFLDRSRTDGPSLETVCAEPRRRTSRHPIAQNSPQAPGPEDAT